MAAGWIEAVHQDSDGLLFGWYRNEPAHFLPEEMQAGRQWPLTAPFIVALVSYDNGHSWDDLGLILTGGEDSLNLENHNFFFAGGNGDFTVLLDRQGEFFYFLFGTYYKDVNQQGISLARMRAADLRCPVGKVMNTTRIALYAADFRCKAPSWLAPCYSPQYSAGMGLKICRAI